MQDDGECDCSDLDVMRVIMLWKRTSGDGGVIVLGMRRNNGDGEGDNDDGVG